VGLTRKQRRDHSLLRQGDITVQPLKLEDVRGFSTWGKHTDVLFFGYDFPDLAARRGGYGINSRLWFYQRQIPFLRWLYGIKDASGNMVGYMKAEKKHVFQNQAQISIVLDPARMDKGYGTEAVRQFLRICFEGLGLEAVWLRVLELNVRARRVYEKAGFEYFLNRQEPYDEQRFREELLQSYPQDFFLKNGKLTASHRYMKLSRTAYEKQPN